MLHFAAGGPERRRCITRHFPLDQPTSVPGPEIVVTFGSSARTPPPRPADVTEGPLRAWLADGFLVGHHDSGLAVRADPDAIEVSGSADAPELWRGFRQLMQLSLSWTLPRHGRTLVHAAAIAHQDGALLVLGGSGRGKSTLAAVALGAGWLLLSDDLVVLRADQEALVVTGLPRPPAVPIELATSDPTPDRPTPRVRRDLPLDVLDRSSRSLAGSILVDWSEGEARLAAAEPSSVFDAVLGSVLVLEDPQVMRLAFTLAAGVARLPSRRLLHDADHERRHASARDLLVALADRGVGQ